MQFIFTRIQRILWYAFLADVFDTFLDQSPLFALTGADARPLLSQGFIPARMNCLAWYGMQYCTLNMLYDTLAIVTVALGILEPKRWPVMFGKWRDSYTVRRFWG